MDRARLVASLPTGPRRPLAATPARPPGSVRRSTAIDQRPGPDGTVEILGQARDLRTRADGTALVLDETRLHVVADANGVMADVKADPPAPALRELVGVPTGSGFRARAAAAVPDHARRHSGLHQLLDDVPLAALLGHYAVTRAHPEWQLPDGAADAMADVCAGWATGGTMLDALARTGTFPVPVGPPAPPLATSGDPLAWPVLEPMAPGSVRRVRRLDLVEGDPLVVEVYHRDSHLDVDGAEDVLHEYTLRATVDPSTLVVGGAVARAHVLPWPECPAALASADRVVGLPLADLAVVIGAADVGTSTCSHLDDLLRSMAGLAALAR